MTINLGHRFPDRQRLSTREPFVWRAEYRLRPIDFTNATVTFELVNADTREVKPGGGTAAGDADGRLAYYPVEWDVDEAGIFECQFTATYGGTIIYRSPRIQQQIVRNPSDPQPPPYPMPTPPPPVGSPYLIPPRAPSPFNAEFSRGDPALERRGWLVYETATGLAMTRAGDVTTAAPGLVGRVYNSTIVAGTLRVQALTGMTIVKPITGGAPCQFVARLADPRVSANQSCFLQLTNWGGYGSPIDNASRRVFSGYLWGKVTYSSMELNQFYYHHRQLTPPADSGTYVVLLEVLTRPTYPERVWRNSLIEAHTGRVIWMDNTPLNMLPIEPTYAGLELVTANTPYSWVEIDYIRSYPAGTWFPP